jgi:pimeloyl-[acyl-carrier protein] methyl ester esterase
VTDAASLPILCLLPGLDGTGKLFAGFVSFLGSRIDTRVLSYPTHEPLGYEALEFLVLAALPKNRPVVLLGESFSGPIAIRIAARPPTGLVGLIVCGSFAMNPFPGLGWARALAAYLPVKSLPRWMRAPLMWGSLSPGRATSQMERAMSGVSSSVIRHRIGAILSVDATAALQNIQLPVLVLRAGRDRVIPRAASQRILKVLPHAQLVEVDGPHLLLQTRPEECGEAIMKFIRSLL